MEQQQHDLTPEQIRDGFNKMISQMTDPDMIARWEIAREYYANPEFRKALEDHTFNATLNR